MTRCACVRASAGRKLGYVFKMADKGLGYYVDTMVHTRTRARALSLTRGLMSILSQLMRGVVRCGGRGRAGAERQHRARQK